MLFAGMSPRGGGRGLMGRDDEQFEYESMVYKPGYNTRVLTVIHILRSTEAVH